MAEENNNQVESNDRDSEKSVEGNSSTPDESNNEDSVTEDEDAGLTGEDTDGGSVEFQDETKTEKET